MNANLEQEWRGCEFMSDRRGRDHLECSPARVRAALRLASVARSTGMLVFRGSGLRLPRWRAVLLDRAVRRVFSILAGRALAGVLGAVIVRLVFIPLGIDDVLPIRLPVYVAIAAAIGFLVSLLGFGR